MSFDQLLRRSGLATGENKKTIVGLGFYYLEEYEDQEGASTGEVRELIEQSRLSLNPDYVSRLVGRLKEDSLITPLDESNRYPKYRMTFEGINQYKDLLVDGDDEPESKDADERFLDTNVVEVDYYARLVNDINKSYQHNINDGALVLTRKFFENLIIDILRAEYGGQGIDLYYNTENGQFWGLGTLCGNLRDKVSELDHYSRQLDNGVIDRVEEFKERGNSQAHSVRVDVSDDEVEAMKDDATELTEILYDIREEVRIANGSSEDSE